VGSAFSGAGIATQVAVGAGVGAGGSIAQQEVFTGHVDWGQVGLSAGVGGVAGGAGAVLGKLAAARQVNAGGRQVIVDTNAVYNRPGVLAALNPGETPVMTQTTTVELRGLATAGRMHLPRFASDLPVINDIMDVNTRINIRGLLADINPRQRGLFGDGSIGATALNRGLPVITSDKALTTVLKSLGIEVRAP
jgi:hypothetical protein